MYQKIQYEKLNSRQQENYNFQKVAAHLADYGFNCLRLTDDWNGADFIACHVDGNTFLKVQLKGRLTINQKYSDRSIYVTFYEKGTWYIYPHDEVRDELIASGFMVGSVSWEKKGGYGWPYLTPALKSLMKKYAI